MVTIFIDGTAVEVKEGATVLRAAQDAGIAIPHFCYHRAFPPEGSCRMCLIQIEGSPKFELACSTPVREGLKVITQSPAVREARRGVLEFLMAEHPLDCPVCDKAGECSLQDYYQTFGLTQSAFRELKEKRPKRVQIGEKLLLDQERCVLCTRCVRFLAGVTKTHELGVFKRGIRSEISTYEGNLVRNNYSGNLVDVCPVGAITDTEFRMKTRTWFMVKGESLCPMCSRGCNIYVDYHPGFPRVPGTSKIYRIRPRVNDLVNGHWICDFGRYGFVGLHQKSRLEKLSSKVGTGGMSTGWEKTIGALAERIKRIAIVHKPKKLALVLNSWLTNEELFLIKRIFKTGLGVERIFFADPPSGEDDGFLLKGERSPNSRGAKELGFETNSVGWESLADTDALLIFGHYLTSPDKPHDDVKAALGRIPTKALFASHVSGLESLVDFVFPTAMIAEKQGSLINADGRLQSFRPVYRPCAEARPEWKILVDLARTLKLDVAYYDRFSDAEDISREIRKEIPSMGNPE